MFTNFQVVNFSYQDLGHDYQFKSFMRIMNKLKNCEDLNLVDDSLRSLRNLTFKKCQKLNLKKNFIISFNVRINFVFLQTKNQPYN